MSHSTFDQNIAPSYMAPLWTRLKSLVPKEPTPTTAAHRWAYADVRPHVLEAGRIISAAQAERRVLILENPALVGSSQITPTLYAGLQLILPGEVAPAHRHTQSALRFVIEGSGAYTTVDGVKMTMQPGDFVITPSGSWHHHGHEASGPMVWLDGLDIPLTHFFGSTFREDDHSSPASAGLWPVAPMHPAPHSQVFCQPWSRTREALHALARDGAPDSHLGYCVHYTHPVDGGWALPTIAAMLRLLPRGLATRPYRSSDAVVFLGVEGRGQIRVGEQHFTVEPHDVVVVPGWVSHTLHASEDWVLFAYSDRAAQEKLGLWCEQRG